MRIPRSLSSSLENLYVVGGAVRDILLGKKPEEFDLITTSFLDDVPLKTFKQSNNTQTVGTYIHGTKYDISHYVSLKDDLERRDFTINSMAIPVDRDGRVAKETLFDPCDGLRDLKQKTLRTFNCKNLFQDPVRVVRGLRFVSEYGFDVEKETLTAMKGAIKFVKQSARERIFPPIEKFVEGKYFSKATKSAYEVEVDKYLSMPIQNFEECKKLNAHCRWPAIFLKTNTFPEFVEIVFPPRRLIRWIRRLTYFVENVEKEKFDWTVKISSDEEINCLLSLLEILEINTELVEKYKRTSLKIKPSDLKILGAEGRLIHQIMLTIWEKILKSEIKNEKKTLTEFARKMITSNPS